MNLTPPFEVVCIDDKNRPQEIPPTKWIKEGQKYTVIEIGRTLDSKPGFKLEEIQLGKDTFPYDCFSVHRFGIPVKENSEADEAVAELLKETDLAEA